MHATCFKGFQFERPGRAFGSLFNGIESYGQVEFVSDAEATMKSLLASVQLLRQHLGYPTVLTHSRPGDKGRTAQIERAIQTLRKQASTLIQMASDKCSLPLPGDHALWPWSFVHATWLLNRYHNHHGELVRVCWVRPPSSH